MPWRTIPNEQWNDNASVRVNLLSTEHDGVTYGAGRCWVRIGHGPAMKAVAVRGGKEKRVTTPDHAPLWLRDRGLPWEIATRLVTDALAAPEPALP